MDLLGINIDNKLKFDKHITGLCRKVSAQLAVLNRFKNILSTDVKLKLYNAFILAHLNYCNIVWNHCGARNRDKLEKVNKRALRFILNDKTSPYELLLAKTKTVSLNKTTSPRIIILIQEYKSLNNEAPT